MAGTCGPASPNRWSDPANWSNGIVHGGWTIAQNSAAAPMPHIVRLTGSRGSGRLHREVRRQVVHDEREHRADRERHAQRVERQALPDLRDDREAEQRRDERDPHDRLRRVVPGDPEPDRDHERRRELDQQRDPDRQPLDRGEVQELRERDAEHAVDEQQRHLAAPEPERGRPGEGDEREQDAGTRPWRGPATGRSRSIPPSSSVFATVPLTANSSAATRYSR